MLVARAVAELRIARQLAGLSQDAVAAHLGCSQATYWRIEDRPGDRMTVVRLSEIAAILGMEVSLGLHPIGDPIRDKGQQALGHRFDAIPSAAWRSTPETLLPLPGDRRSWDRLLRLVSRDTPQVVGVDLETRIRDIQALVRRTRERERDGGVDAILIVLSDSATNRELVTQLKEALGSGYATSPRLILRALRDGRPIPGSGAVLL